MGKRGPKPGMGGRPRTPISEKIVNGNPGKHKLTVIDFKDSPADLEGMPMPKPSDYLSAQQKNGTQFYAVEIYEAVWKWLKDVHNADMLYFWHPKDKKPAWSFWYYKFLRMFKKKLHL